jgi:predicted Zn-dependent protease with MMP-like domain
MRREEFEEVAQEIFDGLPETLLHRIENVRIVVESEPEVETEHRVGLSEDAMLLGLYEGVPLTHRGAHYGTLPAVPDKITLYQHNIERLCKGEGEIRKKIREVLIHEIAHYFGMDEEEIRDAGY